MGGAPASASASTSMASESSEVAPDRILERADQSMPVAVSASRVAGSGETITVIGEIPVPSDIRLSVGETVQINYVDGVVTHTAVTRACTQTATVSLPYKTGSSARSHHEYGLSSGCVDNEQRAEGVMSSHAWPVWHQRAWARTSIIRPGTLISWNVTKACTSNGSTLWRATTGQGANVVAASGEKSLACRV